MKHLIGVDGLGLDDYERLFTLADHMTEVNARANPKVPALRGRTVCSLFFEDSTRTRLSFETAAKRLSADTLSFAANSSSLNKGESLRDTVETLGAMGVDAFVVRHRSSGVPEQLTRWTDASIINAGDGWHSHPTQALLDAYTLRAHLGGTDRLSGLRVGFVGDIKHSRVARSSIAALKALGSEVLVVAPTTLLPPAPDELGAEIHHDVDEVLADIDVLYLLRVQRERMAEALIPTLREYSERFALTPERAARLDERVIVMHPGPVIRGVEITVDPSELSRSVIIDQVSNGISVRMAVLLEVLAGYGLEQGVGSDGPDDEEVGR
jgi:aspartate carbamoyltransferase catalytic subunit